MYSSRSYTRRNKSYYRKKRINRKFSPALYKHDIPTYFQQKGRIIQTTPLRMHPIPTQLPNTKTLENMYNTLLKAKYPNVGPVEPPPPDPPLQSYVSSFTISATQLYNLTDHRLTPNDLTQLTTTYGDLTTLPEGWDYQFDLYTITFRETIIPHETDATQFHIDLVHPILTDPNPYQFVIKTLNTSSDGGLYVTWMTSFIPLNSDLAKITRASFTLQGVTVQNPSVATNDNDITDNGWYPLVSTYFDDPEHPNYIEYVPNTTSISPLNMTLTVLCTPIQSF